MYGFLSSHQDGAVPLEVAAQKGHTETVQRLLVAGTTVNYQDKVIVIPGLTLIAPPHTE